MNKAAFAAHVGRCRASTDAAASAANAADLFLAAAALAGDQAAAEELTRTCWPVAKKYLRRLGLSAAELDDVGQELWKALLMGGEGGEPKLAIYSGRGPLSGFVGITAQRIAMLRLRRDDAGSRAAVRAAAEVEAFAADAELALMKDIYRESFQEVISDVLSSLDDRARMVLRMYIVDGVSIERIAQTYQVGHSTVSRWLEKTRREVADQTRGRLVERLRLSGDEFDSLWRLVVSQLDVSVSRLLGEKGRTPA